MTYGNTGYRPNVSAMALEGIRFVLEAVGINAELSEEKLARHYGMAAGPAMSQMIQRGAMADDSESRASILVAALWLRSTMPSWT